MARPHIPVAIRRQYAGANLEVQTKGGGWIPYSFLGSPSLATLSRDVIKGRVLPGLDEVFEWRADNVYDRDDAPSPFGPDTAVTDQPVNQPVDLPEPTDQDVTDQPSPAPDQPSQQPTTIEDIVRQIAGSMDKVLADKLFDLIDAKLAEFKPTIDGNGRLTPVLTNVTIHRPDVAPLPVDGLFHYGFPTLLKLVANGAHVYLPGSPGTGKSHAAQQVAETLGWQFGSVSLGPTTPESRLLGGMTANGEFFEPMMLKLVRWCIDNPDNGAVFCMDEMDNGHPGVLATLNSLMANGYITAPNGDHLTIGKNMVFVAAANTFGTGPTAEFAGRNKLDPATLNRFRYLPWEIDLGVEEALVRRQLPDVTVADAWLDVWRSARKNVADHGLKIFVTPRGAVHGASDIAAGFSIEEAFALSLGNKVPSDQLAKINPL